MRTAITLIHIILASLMPLVAQVQWSDAFNDQNFTTNPEWKGDLSHFIVNADTQLQLQTTGAGVSHLAVNSPIAQQAEWRFFVQMAFNPSASNYATVHLMMDTTSPLLPHNGYFLRLGGTTERRITLFRKDGSAQTSIGQSAINLVNANVVAMNIRVTRDLAGQFEVFADTNLNNQYDLLFQAIDTNYSSSKYFGLACHYTSTRADKFSFDNFYAYGSNFQDTIAPELLGIQVRDAQTVALRFSEPMANIGTSQVLLFPTNTNPSRITSDTQNPFTYLVTLAQPMQSGNYYQLALTGLTDAKGNRMRDTIAGFLFYQAGPGSVVFNEIMADPDPVVQLPNSEYIELYNRTNFPIPLANWTLQIGTTTRTFPVATIQPKTYLLIVREQDTAAFKPYGQVLGLPLSSTALTNTGQVLVLMDNQQQVVDRVNYSDTWYANAEKAKGGWSLERIDPDRTCGGHQNWKASTSNKGGTPGKKNSVFSANPDTKAPTITTGRLLTNSIVAIQFSEEMAPTLPTHSAIFLDPLVSIDTIFWKGSDFNELHVVFSQPIQEKSHYKVALGQEFSDCSGNHLISDTLHFGLPEFPAPGDVIINEVLFQPVTGGVRFIELYNIGNKVIDLHQLRLGNFDAAQQGLTNTSIAAPLGTLLFPGQYVAITTDVQRLIKDHPQANNRFTMTAQLPAMTVSGGQIALGNASLDLMDYLIFDEKMHHPLLREARGVSLERIRPSGTPNDRLNWTSAAQVAGFATPAAQNSVYSDPGALGRRFSIQDSPFFPNGDGFRDRVALAYELDEAGYVATLTVYDIQGREVARPENQISLATSGKLYWAGVDAQGRKVAQGPYVLYLETLHPNGNSFVFKGVCVVGN